MAAPRQGVYKSAKILDLHWESDVGGRKRFIFRPLETTKIGWLFFSASVNEAAT